MRIARAGLDNVGKARAGTDLVWIEPHEDRFLADERKYAILQAVDPFRIELPRHRSLAGHTQIWLAGAPDHDGMSPG